jgi:thiol-disulfide isomerase/thioredoxin
MRNKENTKGNILLIVIIVLAIVGLGFIGYLMLAKDNDMNLQNISMVNETTTTDEMTGMNDIQDDSMVGQDNMANDKDNVNNQTDDSSMAAGQYVVYSPQVLMQNSDKKRVLFFYANWCPICQPADNEFKSNLDKIPNDVVLVRVNYNDSDTDADEEGLADKYNITYQHTFVQIDSAGGVVAKWNGGGINDLLVNLK